MKRALLAFGTTEASIHDKVLQGINNPIGPVDFKGPPPCQEVVLVGAGNSAGTLQNASSTYPADSPEWPDDAES